jgi:hypothetical protein
LSAELVKLNEIKADCRNPTKVLVRLIYRHGPRFINSVATLKVFQAS